VVAVAEKPEVTLGTAHAPRPRTEAQQKLVDDHVALVRDRFAGRDRRLVKRLLDLTVLWTEDLVRLLGLTEQRTYMLYSAGRDLFEAGELIHPGGIPVADTSGGKRGDSEIRGVVFGRFLLWALGAGRAVWNPTTGDVDWVDPNSNESQVDRARTALTSGKALSPKYYEVLKARADNPGLTIDAIARKMGVTKATYWSRLRRAYEAAERA
jgi:hypothetical protein